MDIKWFASIVLNEVKSIKTVPCTRHFSCQLKEYTLFAHSDKKCVLRVPDVGSAYLGYFDSLSIDDIIDAIEDIDFIEN